MKREGGSERRGAMQHDLITSPHLSVTSVFARAQMKGEETGGKRKHTHIVLCVVVGDVVILQTSRAHRHKKRSANAKC